MNCQSIERQRLSLRRLSFEATGNVKFAGAVVGLSFFVVASTVAGEWDNSASAAVGSYYSTNICLVNPDFADTEGKAVGTFRPQVAVNGVGARSSLNVRAVTEYNTLAESSLVCPGGSQGFQGNRRAWVPNVNAVAEYEVVENGLIIYATGFATQTPINPFAPGGSDNLNALGNSNVVYQWAAGARVDRSLPGDWRLTADGQYNRQYNDQNQFVGNSQENRFNYDLGTEPFASRVFYGSRGQYSEVDFDATAQEEAFSNQLARAELYGGVSVLQHLVVEAAYGQEDNVFTSQDPDNDGSYWDVGLRWQPSNRMSITAGYGERFFGPAPRFSIEYRHKRSALSVSYLRDVNFPRNLRATSQEPSDPLFSLEDVQDVPLGNDGLPTFAANGLVQNDRLSLTYQLAGNRTQFRVAGVISEQTQLANGQRADFQTITVALNRQLSSSLTGTAGVSFNRTEQPLADSTFEEVGFYGWRFNLSVSKPIARKTSVSLGYGYQDQKSDDGALNSFTEQRVSVSLVHRF